VILVQTSHIIFQISAKKRILGSLIFFITSAACTTYIAQVSFALSSPSPSLSYPSALPPYTSHTPLRLSSDVWARLF
jgi:hypothetical protein